MTPTRRLADTGPGRGTVTGMAGAGLGLGPGPASSESRMSNTPSQCRIDSNLMSELIDYVSATELRCPAWLPGMGPRCRTWRQASAGPAGEKPERPGPAQHLDTSRGNNEEVVWCSFPQVHEHLLLDGAEVIGPTRRYRLKLSRTV